MVVLTYDDLDKISAALFFVADEFMPQEEYNHAMRTIQKIDAELERAQDIEPKPQFKLTHEEE